MRKRKATAKRNHTKTKRRLIRSQNRWWSALLVPPSEVDVDELVQAKVGTCVREEEDE